LFTILSRRKSKLSHAEVFLTSARFYFGSTIVPEMLIVAAGVLASGCPPET
jgi:hypothetical protein